MLVRANDSGIAWHMIGDQGVGAHAFFQPEVFAGMPGVNRGDLRFDALSVAAGMLQVINIVLVKHRQRGCCVGNHVVGGMQRFRPQEVASCRQERRVAESGHLRHLPQAHIGAHGDDAGKEEARISFLLDVAFQNVSEGAEKIRLFRDEPQQVGDANARQLTVERTVDGLHPWDRSVTIGVCPRRR